MAASSCSLEHSGAWAYTSPVAGFRTSNVPAVGVGCPSIVMVKSATFAPLCAVKERLRLCERQRRFDGGDRIVHAQDGVDLLAADRQLPRVDADNWRARPQRQRDLRERAELAVHG